MEMHVSWEFYFSNLKNFQYQKFKFVAPISFSSNLHILNMFDPFQCLASGSLYGLLIMRIGSSVGVGSVLVL